MVAEPDDLLCPKCRSPHITKLVSRFRKGRTEDDRLDEIADQVESYGEPDSYLSTRKLVREMGQALDDDYSDEMEELYESDLETDPGSHESP